MKTENFGSLRRKTIIFAIIIATMIILAGRLFQMQIVYTIEYDKKSTDNSIKSIELQPLRGVFYDRNYKVLVSNVPAYTLRITPAYYDTSLNKILEAVIGTEPGYIKGLLKKNKIYSKFLPVKVRRGVDFQVIAWYEENSEHLTGVDYIIEMQRFYPAQVIASHTFGYTKEISPEQLAKEKELYNPGDYVGHNGIEKTYEKLIIGTKGYKYVLVDSRQRQIGRFQEGKDDIVPIKGKDLVLGIEASAQRIAEEQFKGKRGALVAIEPTSGEILAMVSSPDYDLNRFSYFTPRSFLDSIYSNPFTPLFNRATMSIHPPGSTFKMLAAIAALDMGVIDESYTITCGGGFTFGRFFKCHGNHGTVNVVTAIEKSCNSFFYRLIYKIGIDKWKEYATKFGFGKITGVDLTEEVPGLIPDENYYIKRYGEKWPRSIMASLGIGQGEVSVTPLQLAMYASLIANNGKTKIPHVVKGYIDINTEKLVPLEFKEISTGVSQEALDIVKKGMYLVVNGHGTATHIKLPDVEICGKTGTAQNPHGEDHAWFVGFAPYENPKIAIAVLVENVGFGGTHAAPIAKNVIQAYMNSFKGEGSTLENQIAVVKTH
ncbi:MAG: penicillin-binding protein 2 [Ignavibacteriota bacterium]|nr:penicillin-binding protein 2 [Ignavibacteriota bacterium]QKJ97740.1 MAG: penicillin-binding protein 2 [Ignavibacteriota bacterium]GIK61381.1 MAG: penicillin-binding protein 2 [Ignavibacteriota bacterium]GJQ42552.1 MAG: penicillin-binding protein 2 [Ignavibacteriaceae bacterium]